MAQRVGDFTFGVAVVMAPQILKDIIDIMFNNANDDLTVLARIVLKIQGHPLPEQDLRDVVIQQAQVHREEHAGDWDNYRALRIKAFRDLVLEQLQRDPGLPPPNRLMLVAVRVKMITNMLFDDIPPPTIAEMMTNPAREEEWLAAAREHLIQILHSDSTDMWRTVGLEAMRRAAYINFEPFENRAAQFRTLAPEFQVGEGASLRARARAKVQAMRNSRRGGQ